MDKLKIRFARSVPVKDIVIAVSIFHVLSAIALFAYCVTAVLRMTQQRHQA